MRRLRKAKLCVRNRFAIWRRGRPSPAFDLSSSALQVTSVIHARQLVENTTTLRQLHKLSDLDQPQALSVVSKLEQDGVVVLERDLADAFESVIRLSDDALDRIESSKTRKVA